SLRHASNALSAGCERLATRTLICAVTIRMPWSTWVDHTLTRNTEALARERDGELGSHERKIQERNPHLILVVDESHPDVPDGAKIARRIGNDAARLVQIFHGHILRGQTGQGCERSLLCDGRVVQGTHRRYPRPTSRAFVEDAQGKQRTTDFDHGEHDREDHGPEDCARNRGRAFLMLRVHSALIVTSMFILNA